MKEALLVTQIIKEINKYKKTFAYKNVAATAYSTRGIPDIIACINGYFVGIEVKTKKNVASKLQLETGKVITQAGGLFWIITSIPELIENLKTLDIEKKENVMTENVMTEEEEIDEFFFDKF